MFRDSYKTEIETDIRRTLNYLKIRRILEFFIILIFSPVILILMLFLSVLIAADNKGKVFFRQTRIGLYEKEFKIYKFQTFQNNGKNNSANNGNSEISKIGSFLRKHRLDEIPQFINLIKGELCLIGPRPEIINEYTTYKNSIENYPLRKLIPQGITGWAQVNHPHSETIEGNKIKLGHDLFYIKNLSLKLDLLIILKTVNYIFRGRI